MLPVLGFIAALCMATLAHAQQPLKILHQFAPSATFAIALTRFAEPLSAELQRDRKSTRLNSSHIPLSRMPSSA